MARLARVSLILALIAAPLSASNFHYGKTQFQPTDSMAFVVEGPDISKPITLVALTDFKIDRADVLAAIDPVSSLFVQAGNTPANVVFVRLSDPGKCGLVGYLGKTAQQIDLGSSFALKTTASTPARVAGNCSTTTPGKMFEDTYDFNLAYDVPITAIPKPVTLPAGGGDPGAAYVALVKAIQAADWNVARLHLEEDSVKNGKPTDLKEYFHGIGLNYPKQATVSGGSVKGDRALINITGKDREDKKIRGAVAMKKVDGNWRVVDQSMFFTE